MAYTVFARKYRPQTFEELVGQEHVARTLGNAITGGRVAHAFLFTGVRGVGKTTTARLLAKALNCEKGPTPSPCNACAPCTEITSGVDVDVQEIDGASNNSVDDVRRLQESIPYRPVRDRHKIVIVDEVHMLSTGAFNAFLKTLEEPPSHVVFIFATTESHKVPVTIRSRCQRYDFRLIPQAVIADRVRTILSAEGIGADDAAIALVAREAAGSMRDALTLLDQVVALSGGNLEGESVARALGIADREQTHALARAVLSGDAAAALRAIDALVERGADLVHLLRQLVTLARDLVVIRVVGENDALVDLTPDERAQAKTLADGVELPELERAFSGLSALIDDVARSSVPRPVLEMGLVRLATRPALRSIQELLARLDALEHKLGGGSSGGSSGAGGAAGGGPPRGAVGASKKAVGASAAEEMTVGTSANPGPTPAPAAAAPSHGGNGAPKVSVPRAAGEVTSALAAALALAERSAPRAEATLAAAAPAVDEAPTMGAPAAPGGLRRPALPVWEEVVGVLRERFPHYAAFLEHAVPRVVNEERIAIAFEPGSIFGDEASKPEVIDALRTAAAQVLGARPEIDLRFDSAPDSRERTLAAVEGQRREARKAARRREVLRHPRVLDVLEVFPEAKGSEDVQVERE